MGGRAGGDPLLLLLLAASFLSGAAGGESRRTAAGRARGGAAWQPGELSTKTRSGRRRRPAPRAAAGPAPRRATELPCARPPAPNPPPPVGCPPRPASSATCCGHAPAAASGSSRPVPRDAPTLGRRRWRPHCHAPPSRGACGLSGRGRARCGAVRSGAGLGAHLEPGPVCAVSLVGCLRASPWACVYIGCAELLSPQYRQINTQRLSGNGN